jgi:hypothetical protein
VQQQRQALALLIGHRRCGIHEFADASFYRSDTAGLSRSTLKIAEVVAALVVR